MSKWRFGFLRQRPPLFQMGRVLVTEAAAEALRAHHTTLGELLARHQRGDWGLVDNLDRKQNELGLRLRLRLRSIYCIQSHDRPVAERNDEQHTEVWVITTADRSKTTILLPSEIFDEPAI